MLRIVIDDHEDRDDGARRASTKVLRLPMADLAKGGLQ